MDKANLSKTKDINKMTTIKEIIGDGTNPFETFGEYIWFIMLVSNLNEFDIFNSFRCFFELCMSDWVGFNIFISH